jgi:antitoxin HicB
MNDKDLSYYLTLPYKVEVYPEDDGNGFTATIPELPGCITSADSLPELFEQIEEAKQLWLEVALEDGDYIPEPAPVEEESFSGKFVIRIPRSLHRQLVYRAKDEDTSLNQLVLQILSEGMGRWSEATRQKDVVFTQSGIGWTIGHDRLILMSGVLHNAFSGKGFIDRGTMGIEDKWDVSRLKLRRAEEN